MTVFGLLVIDFRLGIWTPNRDRQCLVTSDSITEQEKRKSVSTEVYSRCQETA